MCAMFDPICDVLGAPAHGTADVSSAERLRKPLPPNKPHNGLGMHAENVCDSAFRDKFVGKHLSTSEFGFDWLSTEQ
jgi:hypothetical protein